MNWTDDDVALMLKLIGEGISSTAIGLRFGLTRNAVMGKLHRLKFKIGDLNGFNVRRSSQVRLHRVRPRLALYDGWQPPGKSKVLKFKPRAPKPKPVVNLDHKCTIMRLGPGTCRWPLWGEADTDRFYCGAPIAGKTYCTAHGAAAGRKYEPSGPFVIKSRPAKSPKSMVT